MLPLILEGAAVADGNEQYVETQALPGDCVAELYSIIAMDETTAIATLIEIGIVSGTKRIAIDSTPGNFPAGTSMTIYWPAVLGSGQKVYARFKTPTADDKLLVRAFGAVRCVRDFCKYGDEH